MTTTWNLHPSMTKADMDKFLVAAFAVKENPYSVEELFDAAQDPAAWPAVQKVLALEDLAGSRLMVALNKARKNKNKAPRKIPDQPMLWVTTTLPRVIATWHRLGKGKYVSARPVAARGLPG